MSLHYGNKNITEVYYGSKKIKEIYKGGKLVFGGELVSPDSYIITTNGTRIDFDLDNTPINNLSTSSSSITVNGQSVVKNTIKEVYFGDSYNNITSIRNSFLHGCSGLTSVDLSSLSNITSIGNYFLHNCSGLTTLKMGAETPPTLGYNAFNSTNNLSLISVPCASESAYKSATNWIAKASIIKGDC